MKITGLFVSSMVLASAMAIFAFWAAGLADSSMELAVHWNAAGEADGFMPALEALLFPAGMVAVVGLIFAAIPFIEPLQNRLEGSAPALKTIWAAMLAFLLGLQAYIAAPIFGFEPPIAVVPFAVGILLIVIGNILPKSRPGFFVGIRTPWTIADTDNWIATHRLGGKLFMIAGLIIALAAIGGLEGDVAQTVVLVAALTAAIVPIAYSFWFWHRARQTPAG